MSRSLAAIFALLIVAAADGPLPATAQPHAAGAPAGPGPGCGGSFTAARGDTLYSIARRCETTVTELVQENRLGQPPRLATGQQLDIPGFARGRESLAPPDVDADGPARRPPPPVRMRPDREPPLLHRERNVYYFQAGDTLYSLARWARTSLPALRAANPGLDPREIDAGMAILLPQGAVRPEPMRLRERGRTLPIDSEVAAPRQPDIMPPPRGRPAPPPPPPPMARPAPPRDDEADEADKPKPDDEDEDDGATPGGMDDGEPEPDGMF